MFVMGFRNPIVYASYVLAQAVLVLHLSHGASSIFQTMGWNESRFGGIINKFAIGYVTVIFVGFLTGPTLILLNVIKLPGE